MKPKGINHHS